MKHRRLKQFGISLIIVLSLSANLLASCACSHHSAQTEARAVSCHQMTGDADEMPMSSSDNAAQTIGISDKCHCFVKTAQPFVDNKINTVKMQKLTALLPVLPKATMVDEIAAVRSVKTVLTTHFYNSNYLDKLTPARAPPVL